jgi:transposase
VKSGHGRRRYNATGAYEPIEHNLVSIEGEDNVSQKTVCKLLHKIRYRSGKLPVTLVLDNAAYNRSQKVKALAVKLNIDIEYLPPYSPNLNLIERYWKFLKSECLNAKFYENFAAFKSAISETINKTNSSEGTRAKLKSLITLNFQTFKNEMVGPA